MLRCDSEEIFEPLHLLSLCWDIIWNLTCGEKYIKAAYFFTFCSYILKGLFEHFKALKIRSLLVITTSQTKDQQRRGNINKEEGSLQ